MSLNQRKLKDWVQGYLRYVENTEPPVAYHRWTAISCLASAMQRRCYMNWGIETIFPNQYIVLIGPAALTRKTTALNIGKGFVTDVSLKTIGQDNSPEAVIREISSSTDNFSEGTKVKFQSAVTCFASELSVFLGEKDVKFQAYLTDWYDCPERWQRTTKHQGKDDIAGMCFNMLAATAPDWIPHIFTPETIGGGFTSRIVFVSERRKAKIVANPNRFPLDERLEDQLLHDLEVVSRMVGEYKMTPDAETIHEKWYTKDELDMQGGKYPVSDKSFHTYCGRRSTLARKLSMALAASRGNDLIVTAKDLNEAINLMRDAEKAMVGLFAAVGRSEQAHQIAAVENMIKDRGKTLKSYVLGQLMYDLSSDDLDKIEKTLDAAKKIKITRLTNEGDTEYHWVAKP